MNNSATTRKITKIAIEYNGNDKGTAEMMAYNLLISEIPENQYIEMKTIVNRNKNVKNWALTGYVSVPKEIDNKVSDEELTNIALQALGKVGITDQNQYRLDLHNSTKNRHIHFICNRINLYGICTVKAHNIGTRFGEAVREICKERGLLTDVDIGKQKRATMLENLTNCIQTSFSFDELTKKMRENGYDLQLSTNVKDGISGMRIIMEKDKNHQTERVYKGGYKLSEISGKLKVAEIKQIFELKEKLQLYQKNSSNLKELQAKFRSDGIYLNISFNNDGNTIKDAYFKYSDPSNQLNKNGWFYSQFGGYRLSHISGTSAEDFLHNLQVNKIKINEGASLSVDDAKTPKNKFNGVDGLLDELLKPSYVSNSDEDLWRKRKKKRI